MTAENVGRFLEHLEAQQFVLNFIVATDARFANHISALKELKDLISLRK